jgi:anthranilate synthase component I
VPSQRWAQPFPLPPFALYRSLRRTNPSPFMFFFNFGGFQVVGASPEILVRLRDGRGHDPPHRRHPQARRHARGGPRAGGRPAGRPEGTGRAPDAAGPWPQRRGPGGEDRHRAPDREFIIERYSHVMHIVSNVVGEIAEGEDALSALLAGLPAGTVSGAPKVRAMEIIDELEPEKRGVYGGGVGYFAANGEMDFCIALRTAVLKDEPLYIQAGGGVVYDSDPEAEYQETVNKAS